MVGEGLKFLRARKKRLLRPLPKSAPEVQGSPRKTLSWLFPGPRLAHGLAPGMDLHG